MAKDQAKKVDSKPEPCLEAPESAPAAEESTYTPKYVAEEKTVIPPPIPGEKADECKALVVVEKEAASAEKKPEGSINRGAQKKVSAIGAWENSKKASLEADLKKKEEDLEKKKAEYIEKMNNKIAMVHKTTEEKRAMIEAKRGEDLLKAEETAAKYRATGTEPKKLLGCF
ncbi:hypothetical protein OROGR_011072 [Orobanche gracilis]